MSNNYIIYKHTSPSGKSYIGQTTNYKKRCWEHRGSSNKCIAFRNAIQKYGWDAFTHDILYSNLSIEDANILEEELIIKYNSIIPNGYNIKYGGVNHSHSDETKQKIKQNHPRTGKKFGNVSEETKLKMKTNNGSRGIPKTQKQKEIISHTHSGKIVSEEVRQKISNSKKGKPQSEHHKLKLSKIRKGRIISNETKQKISLTLKNNEERKAHLTKVHQLNKIRNEERRQLQCESMIIICLCIFYNLLDSHLS